MSKINKASIRTFELTVLASLHERLPRQALHIAGDLVKSADIQARLREHLSALDEVDAARAKFREAVATEREHRKALKPVLTGLRRFVADLYGETSADFLGFGFVPRVVAVKSAETKAQAVAKLRATRAAGGAKKSVRQKVSIVGTVEIGASTPSSPTVGPVTTTAATNGATTNGASAH